MHNKVHYVVFYSYTLVGANIKSVHKRLIHRPTQMTYSQVKFALCISYNSDINMTVLPPYNKYIKNTRPVTSSSSLLTSIKHGNYKLHACIQQHRGTVWAFTSSISVVIYNNLQAFL